LVSSDGEYRIDELNPGSYTLKAVGKAIRVKVVPDVKIEAGYSNVKNLTLQLAPSHAIIRTRILDSKGEAIKNATVSIYSSELPASVCDKCVLAEVRSNADGTAEYADLSAEQDYSLAVSVYDEANKQDMRVVATSMISTRADGLTLVELQMSGERQPTMTARVLDDIRPPLERKLAPPQLANRSPNESVYGSPRTVASGINFRLSGVVTRRDADTFTLLDSSGFLTTVRLNDDTSVKTKGGFLRGGSHYAQTSILRGLMLEVEGQGNTAGELVANKVRFKESDLVAARSIESRAAPLENKAYEVEAKLTEVEARAQRLSGQLEELAAVSNAARGGSKAAQQTADAAVAGVNATNERISALDDYAPQVEGAVLFRSGSTVLTDEAKAILDEIARKALSMKGYVLEISGFADSTGSTSLNRALSQRRADSVIRYLVEQHNIPLRRIITPYGYGEINPAAENSTSEGRAHNRRVEIRLLVNKGLNSDLKNVNQP
jgi:outer membrane protein OmpA-like peptidoglycan-associated protein